MPHSAPREGAALRVSLAIAALLASFGLGIFVDRIFMAQGSGPDLNLGFPGAGGVGESAGLETGNEMGIPESPIGGGAPIAPLAVTEGTGTSADLEAQAAAAAAGCALRVSHNLATTNWGAPGSVNAIVRGSNCADASINITINDANGGVIASYDAVASQFGASGSNVDEMRNVLSDALPQSAQRASSLPAWGDGAPPVEGLLVSAAQYNAIRSQDKPIICVRLNSGNHCWASDPNGSGMIAFSGKG